MIMCLCLSPQLESLLQLWLTLSLNSCPGGSDDTGSDIFLFNASRVPTIPLNQGQSPSPCPVLPSPAICCHNWTLHKRTHPFTLKQSLIILCFVLSPLHLPLTSKVNLLLSCSVGVRCVV